MSFRHRVVAIILLALAMLAAAGLTFVQLRREGDDARAEAAWRRGEDALAGVVDAAKARGATAAMLARGEGAAALAQAIDAIIGGVADASAGVCRTDGTLLVTRSAVPPHAVRASRDWLLPADADLASAACRSARADEVHRTQLALPRDLLFATSRAIDGDLVAWTLTRLPPSRGAERAALSTKLAALGVASLLLVVVAIEALVTLRRGTRAVEEALVRLQDDLDAEVPRPRAAELARIAAGLQTMARRLSESRAQERTLARKLSHEERLAALGRVVAGVAHEVRNPLTGIKLKLDGMARRSLDARSAGDVAICLEEVARIDRIVGSLLAVARWGPTARVRVDLGALAAERVARAAAMAEARAVRLEVTGSAEAVGDGEALARVLDNVIRNAIEASPPGDAVRVRVVEEGGEARVEVMDAGAGIPADRAGELFEPFFTLKPEGTGLGLFLSRALVEGLGGRLTYERRGAATAFTMVMPRAGNDVRGTDG